jgi:hypothetical protein
VCKKGKVKKNLKKGKKVLTKQKRDAIIYKRSSEEEMAE